MVDSYGKRRRGVLGGPLLALSLLSWGSGCSGEQPVRVASREAVNAIVTKSVSGIVTKEGDLGGASPVATKDPVDTTKDGLTYADIEPVLRANCLGCHSKEQNNPDLSRFETVRAARDALYASVSAKRMPAPAGLFRNPAERDMLLSWLLGGREFVDAKEPVVSCDPASTPALALPVVMRRLTAPEYDGTVDDIFGVGAARVNALPTEQSVHGFSTVGASLVTGPAQLDVFWTAAESIAQVPDLFTRSSPFASALTCPDGTVASDAACVQESIGRYAFLLYRGQSTAADVAALVGRFKGAEGTTFRQKMRAVVLTSLVSPKFLFRAEVGVEKPGGAAGERKLTAFETASRLSFLLWSSGPDAALLEDAKAGRLDSREGLASAIDRLLSDPRSERFVSSLVSQWFGFTKLQEKEKALPAALEAAMRGETSRFVHAALRTNAPWASLLDSKTSYIDAVLGAHYGIATQAAGFAAHDMTASGRTAGLLTQASVLTLTSNAMEASPIKRGAWVLENLLCSRPPEPPASVFAMLNPADAASPEKRLGRQENPVCASCHKMMDPIGFALEGYDHRGRARPVPDDRLAGTFPDGTEFRGPQELGAILKGSPKLPLCVADRLVTFGYGHAPEKGEACLVQGAVARAAAKGSTLRELLRELILDDAFRNKKEAP